MTRFSEALTRVVIKLSYARILSRTKFVNQKVSEIKNCKNKKIMKNLFDLLVKNQTYNSSIAEKVNVFYAKRCERDLVRNLRQLYVLKNKKSKLVTLIETTQIKSLFQNLKAVYKIRTELA